MIIYLGNAAVHPDVNVDPANPDAPVDAPPESSVTVVHPADDARLLDVLNDVAGLWLRHSTANPSWVASDDEHAAEFLSAHFDCPVKSVDDAETEYAAAVNAGGDPDAD